MADLLAEGVVPGLTTAVKIVKGLKDIVGSVEVKVAVSEVYDVLISTQASALEYLAKQRSLLETIGQLEKELAQLKAWEEAKQRYVLRPPWEGAPFVTYALKESCKGSEGPHWICTKCYDDGRRSILNPEKDKDGWTSLRCPTCKAAMATGYRGYPQPTYAPE